MTRNPVRNERKSTKTAGGETRWRKNPILRYATQRRVSNEQIVDRFVCFSLYSFIPYPSLGSLYHTIETLATTKNEYEYGPWESARVNSAQWRYLVLFSACCCFCFCWIISSKRAQAQQYTCFALDGTASSLIQSGSMTQNIDRCRRQNSLMGRLELVRCFCQTWQDTI